MKQEKGYAQRQTREKERKRGFEERKGEEKCHNGKNQRRKIANGRTKQIYKYLSTLYVPCSVYTNTATDRYKRLKPGKKTYPDTNTNQKRNKQEETEDEERREKTTR